MGTRRAPLGAEQQPRISTNKTRSEPVKTRQQTRSALGANQAATPKKEGKILMKNSTKRPCPSVDNEDDPPRDHLPARIGGCAAQPAQARRRLDDDKENVAPIRQTTGSILRREQRLRRHSLPSYESIAMRTRARARATEASREPIPAPNSSAALLPQSESSSTPAISSEQLESANGFPASSTYQDSCISSATKDAADIFLARQSPVHDQSTDSSSSQPSRSNDFILPRTPSRKRPSSIPTAPSPSCSSESDLFDAVSLESSSTSTTPGTTPQKTLYETSIYAQARSLLRDGPETPLIGRQSEREMLQQFLSSSLELDKEKSSGCLIVSGMPGTGKTALVQDALKERAESTQTMLINCVGLAHPDQVASKILKDLGLPCSHDTAYNLQQLESELAKYCHTPLILVLDEMDHLLQTRVHHNLLYRLFCLPNRVAPSARLALIGIANSLDLTERFVPLLASRGVQPRQLQFQPMGANEVVQVIQGRLQSMKSNQAHLPLFSSASLQLLARKLTATSGDLRRALDTCRQALDLIENEQKPCVQPSHIIRVLSHMAGNVQTVRLRSLGIHAKLLLLAWVTIQDRIAASLPSESGSIDGSLRISELEATYNTMLHDDAGFVSPLETSELLDVLERLEAQGIVRIYSEATGGSTPQAFSKSGGSRSSGGRTRRVSPSGKRAAAKQLLGTNRRLVPTINRDNIVHSLTMLGNKPDEQHSPTTVEALRRLLRYAEDRVMRTTLWQTHQPIRDQIRSEELGGGLGAVPTSSL
ncbi:AAA ATPase [Malassezia yamatoensis]|uniref:AAA ATPase n=1 Tax=Malassezia yamatoensis TaxID=253288 RepID=A0AAJ5YP59_9BASI|nr:AAA ATPase [Malassezia yamatoensis]